MKISFRVSEFYIKFQYDEYMQLSKEVKQQLKQLFYYSDGRWVQKTIFSRNMSTEEAIDLLSRIADFFAQFVHKTLDVKPDMIAVQMVHGKSMVIKNPSENLVKFLQLFEPTSTKEGKWFVELLLNEAEL